MKETVYAGGMEKHPLLSSHSLIPIQQSEKKIQQQTLTINHILSLETVQHVARGTFSASDQCWCLYLIATVSSVQAVGWTEQAGRQGHLVSLTFECT